jgi:hypothetical protein
MHYGTLSVIAGKAQPRKRQLAAVAIMLKFLGCQERLRFGIPTLIRIESR